MVAAIEIGTPVFYTDETGYKTRGMVISTAEDSYAVNIVFPHPDQRKRDQYGRRLERAVGVQPSYLADEGDPFWDFA